MVPQFQSVFHEDAAPTAAQFEFVTTKADGDRYTKGAYTLQTLEAADTAADTNVLTPPQLTSPGSNRPPSSVGE